MCVRKNMHKGIKLLFNYTVLPCQKKKCAAFADFICAQERI